MPKQNIWLNYFQKQESFEKTTSQLTWIEEQESYATEFYNAVLH